MRWLIVVAGFVGASGLIGATIHAHLRPVPAIGQAAYIALFHAPVLLWLSRVEKSVWSMLLGMGFIGGVGLFTGTIYLRYLGGIEKATVLAPVGGTLLILSWIGLAIWGVKGE
ncbi:MAG: DUF423 domain-containing protein, partial [Bacteroidia bacterium]|nr:DUF423 domain-containing protein [Bacteroidia bacterium]MDW8058178.1 DUF423 domain-containing protein [Bacteroidia bacterium]